MRWWMGVLVLAGSLACSQLARAAVTINVYPGIDGNGFRLQDYCCPVFVEVKNTGGPIRGDLRIPMQYGGGRGSVTRPVDLPAGANKRYTLYLPSWTQQSEMQVELATPRRVYARAIVLKTSSPEDVVVAGLGVPEGSLSSVVGTHPFQPAIRPVPPSGYRGSPPGQSTFHAIYLRPDLLPDQAIGYYGVDLLVIGPVSARSLSAESQAAIRRWVAAGGNLAIVGGADSERLRHPFYRDLLPVEVSGTREMRNLNALGRAYGARIDAMPAAVVDARPKAGAEVLVEQSGTPLIVDGAFGVGHVTFLAFDHSDLPVRAWQKQGEVWRRTIARARKAPPVAAELDRIPYQGDPIVAALANLPALRLPSFASISLFLFAYLMVLVPLNYHILGRLRRRELAWLTTPAIVLVFTLGAYGIGYGTKGGRVLTNEVAVVEARADVPIGTARTYLGVFSPKRAKYQISFADPSAAVVELSTEYGGGGEPLDVVQDEDVSLKDVRINMWSMRTFWAYGTADLGKGVSCALTYSSKGIEGTITNQTGFELEDCALVQGSSAASIGTLKPGQKKRVSAKPSWGSPWQQTWNTNRRGPVTDEMVKSSLGEIVTLGGKGQRSADEVLLVGWSHRMPSPVDVRPRGRKERSLACYILHLPIRWQEVAGVVALPAGTIARKQASVAGLHTRGEGAGSRDFLMSGGYVIYSFQLPEEARRATSPELTVLSRSTSGGVDGFLWEWGRRRYRPVSLTSGAAKVKSPERLISRSGEIRLKLSIGPGVGSAELPDVDLEFSGRRRGS